MTTLKPLTLKIYRAPSGKWSGHLIVNGAVIGAISGCANQEVVEHAAREQGFEPDVVEIQEQDA